MSEPIRGLRSPKELMIEGVKFQKYNLIWMFNAASETMIDRMEKDEDQTYALVLGISVPYRFSKIYKQGEYKSPQELANAFKKWYSDVHRLSVYWKTLTAVDPDVLSVQELDMIDKGIDSMLHVETRFVHHPHFYEKHFCEYRSLEMINQWMEQMNDIDYDTLISMVESICNPKEESQDDKEDKDDPLNIILERMTEMINDGLVITDIKDVSDKGGKDAYMSEVSIYVPDKNSPIYRSSQYYHTPDEMVDFFGQNYSAIIGMDASRNFSKRFNYLTPDKKNDLFDFALEKLRNNIHFEYKRVNSIPVGQDYKGLKVATLLHIKNIIAGEK